MDIRVSLKIKFNFLRPGDLTLTAFKYRVYEKSKRPIAWFFLYFDIESPNCWPLKTAIFTDSLPLRLMAGIAILRRFLGLWLS